MNLFSATVFFAVVAGASGKLVEDAPSVVKEFIGAAGSGRRELQNFEADGYFVLVNAEPDRGIQYLDEGDTINLFVTGRNLNVYGVPMFPDVSKSCMLSFDGKPPRLENVKPYSLFGDVDNDGDFDADFNVGRLPVGEHTITATLFSENKGEGDVIGFFTVTFTVVNERVPTITDAYRISAPEGEILEDVSCPLGLCFYTSFFKTEEDLETISFMALAKNAKSVKVKIGQAFPDFTFDDPLSLTERIENVSPYTLTGDTPDDGVKPFIFNRFSSNKLEFTPYSERDGKGIEGPTLAISIVVSSCVFEEPEASFCPGADEDDIGICDFAEAICPVACGLCE